MMLRFFFFKQKTAYEMRISDWSSDVCSSDLGAAPFLHPSGRPAGSGGASPGAYRGAAGGAARGDRERGARPQSCGARLSEPPLRPSIRAGARHKCRRRRRHTLAARRDARLTAFIAHTRNQIRFLPVRTEEHTSELQAHTRNSYDTLPLNK